MLGAGIMGGGIAYQSAVKGTPILMKDIREEAIQLGLNEASKLLGNRVEKGRLTPAKMAEALNAIRPTLSYGDFANVDIVVEAVVENPKVKQAVLAEVEGQVKDDAILASNTSTISINLLAKALKRPENFVGMHFFNPVHMMPLVEVIRGEKSSEVAVATTVAYAKKMGKNPIVVNDCPGFLVNRVLFPYFGGFAKLVSAGVDFVRIDKVMEKFGWPMGPAYLMDVVGIDTGHHGRDVMAEGFPDRMKDDRRSAVDALYEANRLGQKNGKGFYAYETDKRGKPKKVFDATVLDVLKPIVFEQREVTDEDIINWMMVRCAWRPCAAWKTALSKPPPKPTWAWSMALVSLRSAVVRCATSTRSAWPNSSHWPISTPIWGRCTTRLRSCVKWPRTASASSTERSTS